LSADPRMHGSYAGFPKAHHCVRTIKESSLVTGGFSEQPGGPQRQDSSAWAIMAPAKLDPTSPLLDPARACLQTEQLKDGRLSIPKAEMVFWPTPIAALAWYNSERFREAQNRAVGFILKTTGIHGKRDPDYPVPHDPSITGWPCSKGTHSFGEPISLTLLALDWVGLSSHSRFQERLGMLMDRQ
jgi:hypothetical protein